MSIEYRTKTMMEMSKKRDDFARELEGRASKQEYIDINNLNQKPLWPI